MSCENCEQLTNNLCPGIERGAFCTEITQEEMVDNRPANQDAYTLLPQQKTVYINRHLTQ